jgi:hypothetical protein
VTHVMGVTLELYSMLHIVWHLWHKKNKIFVWDGIIQQKQLNADVWAKQ